VKVQASVDVLESTESSLWWDNNRDGSLQCPENVDAEALLMSIPIDASPEVSAGSSKHLFFGTVKDMICTLQFHTCPCGLHGPC
jgi:hypothetical protein